MKLTGKWNSVLMPKEKKSNQLCSTFVFLLFVPLLFLLLLFFPSFLAIFFVSVFIKFIRHTRNTSWFFLWHVHIYSTYIFLFILFFFIQCVYIWVDNVIRILRGYMLWVCSDLVSLLTQFKNAFKIHSMYFFHKLFI